MRYRGLLHGRHLGYDDGSDNGDDIREMLRELLKKLDKAADADEATGVNQEQGGYNISHSQRENKHTHDIIVDHVSLLLTIAMAFAYNNIDLSDFHKNMFLTLLVV